VTFRTRTALALIFVLTLCTRLAFFASNPTPGTGPWVYSEMAHNIIDDGHWFQTNLTGPSNYLELVARRVWLSTIAATDLEWMHRGTKTPFAYPRGPIAYVIDHPFQLVQVVLMPLVFLFAMLSLAFTWARYKHEHLLLVAMAVTITLPYLISHVEPRYMLPTAIAYLMWIGLGADLLIERLSLWHSGGGGRTAREHSRPLHRIER